MHRASAEFSVCFCFHGPKDLFFSPLCFLVLCTECSPYLLSLREEGKRLCYPFLFHFITVVLEFRPQKAGAGLSFSLTVWAVCPLLCREVVLLSELQTTYKSAFGTLVHGGTHGILVGVEGMGWILSYAAPLLYS